MKKRMLSLLLTLCMVLMFVPQTVFAEGETSTAPSVSAYATKAQLMDGTFKPDANGTATNYGKLVFGKDSSGNAMEWYILGSDSGVSGDNTAIFAATPIVSGVQFEDDYINNKTYQEGFGTYQTTPTEVYPNHYGASDLRVTLNNIATDNNYFTAKEQSLLLRTQVITTDAMNNTTYTTDDILYALHGDYYNNDTTLYAGSNNDKALAMSTYWNTGERFWLRAPYDINYEFARVALPGICVSFISVDFDYGVQPASNLNLSSVIFASAAPAASSDTVVTGTIQTGKAMTLRLDGTDRDIGTVTYNTTTGDIKAVKGSTSQTVALVVQGNDGTNNWYYSKKITGTEVVNTSSIASALSLSNVDLSTCKIWLEATKDNMAYAVKATETIITDISSVAITDIETPAVNTTLDTSASCATTGVSSTTPQITWTPNDSTAGYNTSYTASVVLTAATGYEFADTATATVNGKTATSVKKNADGTLTVTYTFPEILDTVDPVISGIEDGKTYCSAQTVTVSDNDAIATVTVNGTEVNLDANKQFTLPANGEQTIVATDKAGNETSVTVTVNDGHTAGNDDGDCSTPVYCIYHPDIVVVAAKSHDFSGEWHNDGTGHWHVCQNDGCTVSETETPHSGTDDGDCTTAVICECGYVITAANAKHTYGEWQSNSDDTHTRYCTVDGCSGYEDGNCEGGEASYFNKAVCDTCHAEYGALRTDSTAPTGEIAVGTNKWNSFLNTITFGLFFKDTQSVTVTAADDSYDHAGFDDDKAVKVAYYLHSGDTVLTKEDLASKEFTIYDGGFNINPDNKYVVYARLTDHAGNVTYISSNGIVLDSVVPVISGIENGKTYCEEQTFTVSEKYIKSVTVNGTEVTLDENNQFTLSPAEGTQTIVITDKAGNVSAETTVTVNDGHTAGNDDGNCSTPVYCIYHPDTVVVAAKSHDFSGEWQKNGTDHWHICQNDGCTVAETETPHSCTDDGDCTTAVVCECGYVITAANAKHTYGEWQSNSDDTHTRYCTVEGCNGYEDGNCAGGEATCVAKAVCDTCKAEYGEIDSANHNLEKIPAKDATVTETGNTEYWHCQDCGKYFADENGTKEIKLEDTIISKLSPEIIEGKGQSITAGEKKELIFKSNAAFSDFIRVELDGKTLDEKNYTVKEGSTVVTLKADYVATLSAGEHTIGIVSESGTATTTFTVNAKAVVDNDTKSPQTGDNSHMALWIALLFMSGAGVIGTMVYGKKKRAK